MGVNIDGVVIITHILSNLREEYKNIIENFEDRLDCDIYMLTIERIWDKLSDMYNRMSTQSNQTKGKESEKVLYVRQIKVTCYSCDKYGHNSRYFMERK